MKCQRFCLLTLKNCFHLRTWKVCPSCWHPRTDFFGTLTFLHSMDHHHQPLKPLWTSSQTWPCQIHPYVPCNLWSIFCNASATSLVDEIPKGKEGQMTCHKWHLCSMYWQAFLFKKGSDDLNDEYQAAQTGGNDKLVPIFDFFFFGHL